MRLLRKCGFFSDLSLGDAVDPTLQSSLGDPEVRDNAKKIAWYLRAGVPYAFVPIVVHDILTPEHPAIGPLRYLTDGEWVWRSDLAHYVETYNCRLPAEFIARMKQRDWRLPEQQEVDVRQVAMAEDGSVEETHG